MRAANEVKVSVVTSERDTKDGITVNATNRKASFNKGVTLGTALASMGIFDSNGDFQFSVFTDKNGNLAKQSNVYYTVTTADGGLFAYDSIVNYPANGDNDKVLPEGGITVTISVLVDHQHYGTVTGGGADSVDDRDQVGYNVYLQSSIGSEYYSMPVYTYWTNAGDDVAKLVTNGDYTGLPGWEVPAYDAEGNEYYYHYEIKDGAIYGTYVKSEGSKFAKSTTNDKDTNGDGKVSCDEYYGTTGLVWSDEKNACVVESKGAVVVTIPNTATK